jgi:hypothetical protein
MFAAMDSGRNHEIRKGKEKRLIMKLSNAVIRGLAVFVAFSVIQMIAGLLIPMKPFSAPHILPWLLLMNAVVTVALSMLAVRTEWRRWRLGITLAAIPLAINSVNLLEGTVFLKNSHLEWGRIFVYTLACAVLMVPVWMLLFGRRELVTVEHYHPTMAKSHGERAWKFALSDLTYLVLYYAAGLIIYPYVKDFYATQQLPPPGTIVTLQLLIRGPVFVLLCLAMARMLDLPRVTGALALGFLFTLLSGAAPLLMPNPYFPDPVRWVHFCEVTSSNFVFGAFVGWLWGKPEAEPAKMLQQAA